MSKTVFSAPHFPPKTKKAIHLHKGIDVCIQNAREESRKYSLYQFVELSLLLTKENGKLLSQYLEFVTHRDNPLLIKVPIYRVGFGGGSRSLPLREIGLDIQRIVENYHKVVYFNKEEDVKVPLDIVDERLTEREYEDRYE